MKNNTIASNHTKIAPVYSFDAQSTPTRSSDYYAQARNSNIMKHPQNNTQMPVSYT